MSTSCGTGGGWVSVGCCADVRVAKSPNDTALAMLRRRSAMSDFRCGHRSHILEIAAHAAVRGRHLRTFVRHAHPHGLLRGSEHVDIGRATERHRLDAIPDDVALLVDAVRIGGGGDNVADHHHAREPFLDPYHLAFEMTQAFLDARWFHPGRGKSCQPRLVELIDTARKRQPDNAHLLKNLTLE